MLSFTTFLNLHLRTARFDFVSSLSRQVSAKITYTLFFVYLVSSRNFLLNQIDNCFLCSDSVGRSLETMAVEKAVVALVLFGLLGKTIL